MKKHVFLMLLALPFVCSSCSKEDDDKAPKSEITLSAQKGGSPNTPVPALFYVFEDGTYSPTTFARETELAYKATLKNNRGEIVASTATLMTTPTKTAEKFTCKPGRYYIVCVTGVYTDSLSLSFWKAAHVDVTKTTKATFSPTFNNIYNEGYVEWDE